MQDVEQRLRQIEERNQRVEADKGWETSWVRRSAIVVFTYATILAYGLAIDAQHAALNAVVPCLGFILSTLALPPLKAWWIERRFAHERR